MNRVHLFYLNADATAQRMLAELGIDVDLLGREQRHQRIVLREDDQKWHRVKEITEFFKGHETCIAEFSDLELKAARFMQVDAREIGYSWPQHDVTSACGGTYDLSARCEACGNGRVQQESFHLNREPRWGRSGLGGLTDIADELFTTPEAWHLVFAPLNIDCRPVLLRKSGDQLETCVQLIIQDTVSLKMADWAPTTCPNCGNERYPLFNHDFMPGPVETDRFVFKSEQWFGQGYASRKYIYFHHRVYDALLQHKIKGGVFRPCKSPR